MTNFLEWLGPLGKVLVFVGITIGAIVGAAVLAYSMKKERDSFKHCPKNNPFPPSQQYVNTFSPSIRPIQYGQYNYGY